MSDFRREFVEFAVRQKALLFGEFVTKAGRKSPYFFDAGVFSDGQALATLAGFYAKAIIASGLQYDLLFGPAYKGIPLVAATAMSLAGAGRNVGFSFNRKEEKDHGEGGSVIGAKLRGQVLIVDDVISAGTSVRQSVSIIRGQGAQPCGVVIAIDRMERGQGGMSAAQEVAALFGLPVVAVANLDDLFGYLAGVEGMDSHLQAMAQYRERYGVRVDVA